MNDCTIENKLQILDALQSSCTRCGVCLESCATYQASGWEHESPRGRILLAESFLDGKIHPGSAALQTFDRCLGCRACENSCPEGVKYHAIRNIVQELRITTHGYCKPDPEQRKWIKLAWRIGDWRWRVFGWRWLKGVPQSQGSYLYKNAIKSSSDITLAVGCIQDLYHHELIDQTIQILKKLDIQVTLERRQSCCGSIFERLNHFDQINGLQNTRKDQFINSTAKYTSVCFLSQNCQQFFSENCAQEGKTIDLYQLMWNKIAQNRIKLRLIQPLEIYYQPYCMQKGMDTALKLLAQIEGLKIKTIWPLKSCCGGCNGEALLNPDTASSLRASKLKNLPKNAVLVVKSFDCWMQYRSYVHTLYPIQIFTKVQFTY
jgi:glycolate oxidase iron-sulfur subunit